MNEVTTRPRFQFVDMLRGLAILLMFVFHFSFDLDYFGVVSIDFLEDPFWLNFRVVIVSLFLLVMGISLYLAAHKGIRKKSYFRRLGLLILYAGLVSVGSWFMFPETWIWFGILHFIALASVLGLLFVRLGIVNLLIGSAVILLGAFYTNPVFDTQLLQWVGMVTDLPYTEDYVPLFPWFGVVLIGIYVGQQLLHQPQSPLYTNLHNPVVNSMAVAGRHSLHIYILHQPVFIGILWIFIG